MKMCLILIWKNLKDNYLKRILIAGEDIFYVLADELLELSTNSSKMESVLIGTFNEEPTRVLYVGLDINSMKSTIDKLKLPNSWPSNIGEKVFYRYKEQLDNYASGSISIEQSVISGKEVKFEMVFKKLIDIYNNNSQIIEE